MSKIINNTDVEQFKKDGAILIKGKLTSCPFKLEFQFFYFPGSLYPEAILFAIFATALRSITS